MGNKIIAGITTFNPNIIRLKNNIDAILPQVSKLLIIDNGSHNIVNIREIVENIANIILIENNENKGIAYSMNQIGWYAYENEYKWFLTLDQDSVCPNDMINKYLLYINPHVAIISPHIENNPPFIKLLLHLYSNKTSQKKEVEKVLYAVSSGQLINTQVWYSVNGFWNYLFIDYVDQEFCFNVTKYGYDILRINSCILSHEPGIPVKILGIPTAKQSSFREYYWARNSFLVYWLYKKQYKEAGATNPIFVIIKRMANSILVGEDVNNKLHSIVSGVKDAFSWRKRYGNNRRVPIN